MKSVAEAQEERIRKRAYHIWEASGRPSGRDEEFWHRACEMIAANNDRPNPKVKRRRPMLTQPASPPSGRSRTTSPPASLVPYRRTLAACCVKSHQIIAGMMIASVRWAAAAVAARPALVR